MSRRSIVEFVTRSVLSVVVCGVGAQHAVVAQKKSAPDARAEKSPPPQLVWPLPPEPPRIRFLRAYRGPDDVKGGKKKSSRLASLILGPQVSGQVTDALVKPYGVAASSAGVIYVADSASRRVHVFNPEARTVTFLGERGNGRLVKPIGVTVDAADVVYVADATLKRVFGYGPEGALRIALGRDGELENPSGIAIDPSGERLYVADASKHHVVAYSTETGAIVRTIGRRGEAEGEFNFPTNIAVDRRGWLYVADTLNFRIQMFDAEGRFVRTFGQIGDSFGSMNRPKGIAVDSEGHVYVVDASFNNFQIFDEQGQLLLFVGSGGAGSGEFFLPAGMFIDAQDRIYVADQGNARVQVFQYLNGASR